MRVSVETALPDKDDELLEVRLARDVLVTLAEPEGVSADDCESAEVSEPVEDTQALLL